jgi:hypothetical protein
MRLGLLDREHRRVLDRVVGNAQLAEAGEELLGRQHGARL